MSALQLTHLGGPTVLLEVDGWRLLTDPTFDAPGRTYRFGWGTGSRKTSGPAAAPADLGAVDAVLLTHDHHADNLDDAGRALLPHVGAVLTTASGARRLGGSARGLRPWDSVRLEAPGRPALTVTATPCRHGPPASRPVAGDVIGFALDWDGQRHGQLWVSGDTVLHRGLRQVADRIDVGTAVLHLGAVRFRITGPLRYSMSGRDAAALTARLRPHTAVPVHYEGWSHFTQGRDRIERDLAAAPHDVQDRVRWAPIGSPLRLEV